MIVTGTGALGRHLAVGDAGLVASGGIVAKAGVIDNDWDDGNV